MREIDMAMRVAVHSWWGSTSISEGAQHILSKIYSPHVYCGAEAACTRCGHGKTHRIHVDETLKHDARPTTPPQRTL